jgi:hypothetical protein
MALTATCFIVLMKRLEKEVRGQGSFVAMQPALQARRERGNTPRILGVNIRMFRTIIFTLRPHYHQEIILDTY